MRIALTIVDTPGFGDNIDNEFAYVSHLPCFFLPSFRNLMGFSFPQLPGNRWLS